MEGVQFFGGKHYEGVWFNIISVTRGWVGVQILGKKRYVTLAGPLTKKKKKGRILQTAHFLLTQECFRESSFSRLECGVHDRLHIYPLCGIVYFPWAWQTPATRWKGPTAFSVSSERRIDTQSLIIIIIIMAGMAVFYVAGYLIEERRRWPVITDSPRGQCYK